MRDGGQSPRSYPVVTVLRGLCFVRTREASHGGSTEGIEFPRGNILVSITPVGRPHRMARNRIVQVASPTTPVCKSQSDGQSGIIVSLAPSATVWRMPKGKFISSTT